MINEVIFTVTESLDGGYEAKAVGHSIYTQCDEYSVLTETLRDAVKCHFDENSMPSLIRVHFVKDEVFAVTIMLNSSGCTKTSKALKLI